MSLDREKTLSSLMTMAAEDPSDSNSQRSRQSRKTHRTASRNNKAKKITLTPVLADALFQSASITKDDLVSPSWKNNKNHHKFKFFSKFLEDIMEEYIR